MQCPRCAAVCAATDPFCFQCRASLRTGGISRSGLGCLSSLFFGFTMLALLVFFVPLDRSQDAFITFLALAVMSIASAAVGWVGGWFIGLFICNH
jgi:hypothetical protein